VMNPRVLVIDTFRNNSPVVSMRITHTPTGISVQGAGTSFYRLKEQLMDELRARITLTEDEVTHLFRDGVVVTQSGVIVRAPTPEMLSPPTPSPSVLPSQP
jgi:hypothetical protein